MCFAGRRRSRRSFVARCRRLFGQKRVGHAGTLDPGATGVLLVGLGRVTRLLRYLTDLPKTYECEVVLGVATSTLDAAGAVTGEWDMSSVSPDDVARAAHRTKQHLRPARRQSLQLRGYVPAVPLLLPLRYHRCRHQSPRYQLSLRYLPKFRWRCLPGEHVDWPDYRTAAETSYWGA